MKKSLFNWNKEISEDEKIVKDIKEYTKGKIDVKAEDLKLKSTRELNGNNNNNKKNNNNNNRRRG